MKQNQNGGKKRQSNNNKRMFQNPILDNQQKISKDIEKTYTLPNDSKLIAGYILIMCTWNIVQDKSYAMS